MGKPAGIRTARKHVKNRRIQRWADLDYKKAHLGTRWKANPFGGASHAKGIVLEKVRLNLEQVLKQIFVLHNWTVDPWSMIEHVFDVLVYQFGGIF
jgi:hypothetical protein